MDIDAARRATAEAIYTAFDYGYPVKDASGWEWSVPGTELVRAVFFDPDVPGGPSVLGAMTVRFEGPDSPVPVDAFATVARERVGNIGGGTLRDYMVEPEAIAPSI
jgi:hypothetical protein